MIGIVLSQQDPAAKTMLPHFLEHGFVECGEGYVNDNLLLATVEEDIIHAPNLDSLGCEYLVFASRHKSESGKPTLSVHPTGNFGNAEFGGQDRTLQNTIANPMRNVFLELLDCPLNYSVCREATHHGPTGIDTPLFFAELGSTEKQWKDPEAAAFLVERILKGIKMKDKAETCVAFGGGHYCPQYSECTDFAFGHICAKYALNDLTESMVKQMVERTADGVDFALMDNSLKGRHKVIIKTALEELGVEYR
ncbi:MAG: hypothetical protein JW834_00050 [Candidatus Diapherotrites archaeon]|nr:hypothetical protein [Candidatus Diapherotrites archaeon]